MDDIPQNRCTSTHRKPAVNALSEKTRAYGDTADPIFCIPENLCAFTNLPEVLLKCEHPILSAAAEDKALLSYGIIKTAGIAPLPYGDISFTELISLYREKAREAAISHDIFLIDGMTEMYDVRAALLACKKEHKPIIAAVSAEDFCDGDISNRLLSLLIVSQELGACAFGIKGCPIDLCERIITELLPYSKVPLIALPSLRFSDNGADKPDCGYYRDAADRLIRCGVCLIGCADDTDDDCRAALEAAVKERSVTPSVIEKADTSLIFAAESSVFFLQPDTTEFSPPIECEPDMDDVISDACGGSYDVLTISINSPDDAIDFCKNMHMATLPAAFLSDDIISLKMALMLYQGRAIIDTGSLIERGELEKIAEKYGAVLY